jgi:hypothetical protein
MNRFPIIFSMPLLVLLTSLSCQFSKVADYFSQEPNGDAVRQVITTAVPMGFATSIAFAAASGQTLPASVHVTQSIGSFPGSAVLIIHPSADQQLPPGVRSNGQIAVAGYFNSADAGVLSVFFIGMSVRQGGIVVSRISTFPVTRNGDTYMLTYAKEDINAGTTDTVASFTLTPEQMNVELNRLASRPSFDSTITLDQEGWVVEVDPKATPADPFDDTYSIIGAGQHIGLDMAGEELTGGELVQVIFIECQLSNACVRNPIAGSVLLRKYGAADAGTGQRSVFGTSWWHFHSTCDGKAEIPVGTGTYIGFSGKSVNLNL